ncbi:hypothetical protein THOM_0835 [Trachipleistophora hominis]|uniref:Uncharacterized protein n=1 Tax=Trachipleistophora hominis TaxID=72359 RepID=L7JYU0_TRAHO|nr:hypothetical protein THOM_0835 [Trachipleistophora hominis]
MIKKSPLTDSNKFSYKANVNVLHLKESSNSESLKILVVSCCDRSKAKMVFGETHARKMKLDKLIKKNFLNQLFVLYNQSYLHKQRIGSHDLS